MDFCVEVVDYYQSDMSYSERLNKYQDRIRTICKILLVLWILALPFAGFGFVFGLAGSTAQYFVVMGIGYAGVLLGGVATLEKVKYFPAMLVALVILIAGVMLDALFWKKHNRQLCEDIRSNPACVETEHGFDCPGFVTGRSICSD